MKKNKIPTILGVLILIVGVATGVLLVQNRQFFRLGAEGELSPRDVRVTNITESSFTVSWTTDKITSGFVKYGTNSRSLNEQELDEIAGQGNVHYTTIQGLSSKTSYYFKINSGGDDFDNNGIVWQTSTGSQIPQEDPNIVSGVIFSAIGTPVENAIVYVSTGGAIPLSTTTSPTGTWLVNLSSALGQDLTQRPLVDSTNSLLEISVQAGPLGVATAQIYPQSAKPAPPITLGQTHDFRSLPPVEESEIPQAQLNFPEGQEKRPGFDVSENTTLSQTEVVTISSIDDGEIITTTNPEFFGEGPAGTNITILVETEAQTGQTDVNSGGNWSWSPDQDLSEGAHTITITWTDVIGIVRTITRTFIVQAAEGPSFESTPSATPTSTPTASPNPTPSPTASPTSTPIFGPVATPTGSPSPTSTPSAAPTATPGTLTEAGSLTPTYLLTIMGIGLLFISGIASYSAFQEE